MPEQPDPIPHAAQPPSETERLIAAIERLTAEIDGMRRALASKDEPEPHQPPDPHQPKANQLEQADRSAAAFIASSVATCSVCSRVYVAQGRKPQSGRNHYCGPKCAAAARRASDRAAKNTKRSKERQQQADSMDPARTSKGAPTDARDEL